MMTMAGMILLTSIIAVPGVQCNPDAESNINDFVVRFTVPEQASLPDRDDIVKAMEDTVRSNAEEWGVRVFRADLGGNSTRGRLYIYLEEDAPLESRGGHGAGRATRSPPSLPGSRSRSAGMGASTKRRPTR